MAGTKLNCPNCKFPIDEPKQTHNAECPRCNTLILIPSIDYENLVNDPDIKKKVGEK